MSGTDLIPIELGGLGGPAESRPSLPRWAFEQATARGWRFYAEYSIPPEHSDPEDDWSLEPYWTIVIVKRVQVVAEDGGGEFFFQAFELLSWEKTEWRRRYLYPELLRTFMDMGDRELWRIIEEAA